MFSKKNKGLFALVLTLFMFVPFVSNAQDGEALFKTKCATCHQPHKDMTGPALFNIRDLWTEAGEPEEAIIQWVHNWKIAVEKYPYAKEVEKWSPSAMTTFPTLTAEEITSIFEYVDATPMPGANKSAGGGAEGGGGTANTPFSPIGLSPDSGLNPMWYVFGSLFLVIIFALSGVKRKLQEDQREEEGKPRDENKKFITKKWAWKNKKYIGIGVLIVTVGLITWSFMAMYTVGIVSGYHPSQPIAFPHDVHAGINGIDCKYCHNSANKSRTSGLPTTNVCMNCHKMVNGATPQAQKEINKIYESAGFSPEGGGTYSGETKNIVWNKVHTLPDYVFFSHRQHVEVGGVDCAQCHGDMTKRKETAQVMPVEELNKIEGNIKLKSPTLTMGWCIECHDQKSVSDGPLNTKGGYYDEIHQRLLDNDPKLYKEYLKDGKVTVKELGGWECAKCHY